MVAFGNRIDITGSGWGQHPNAEGNTPVCRGGGGE
jgi:hypothetical protein